MWDDPFTLKKFYAPVLSGPWRRPWNTHTILSEQKKLNFSSFAENLTSNEQNVYEITLSARGYGTLLKSRLVLPIDLSNSVGEVCVITDDSNLSNFQNKVLNLVENEPQVLIIEYFTRKLDLIKNKLPQDSFIVHTYWQVNEAEASEWITGKSGKKFLIADDNTVPGFEFGTVIIVAHSKRHISSTLCQRATARLIVCDC